MADERQTPRMRASTWDEVAADWIAELTAPGAGNPVNWLRQTLGLPETQGRTLGDLGRRTPGPPTLREPTYAEMAEDRIRELYGQAAEQPVGRVSDALGVTDLQGIASAEPPPLLTTAAVTPKGGGGFFSRVDDAVARLLPAKGAHPNKVTKLLKDNASAEELAYRKVPEFLAGKGNASVTPAELQAHLAAHPAPVPEVKTLAAGLSEGNLQRFLSQTNEAQPARPQEWTALSDRLTRVAQQWQRNGDRQQANRFFRMSEEATEMAEGLDLGRGLPAGQPKYAQYQLPGGEAYRETLLTLPAKTDVAAIEAAHATEAALSRELADKRVLMREAYDLDDPATYRPLRWDVDELTRRHAEARSARRTLEEGAAGSQFRGDHFDEPNILVHTRSNERVLPTGERGRFLEEVQSDWHQKGKSRGYKVPSLTPQDVEVRHVPNEAIPSDAYWETYDRRTGDLIARHPGMHTEAQVLRDAVEVGPRGNYDAVPDAPFKEAWPDLALKQHLLETAQDPNAQWLGLSSADTQIKRWGSERLRWQPVPQQSEVLGRPAWTVTFEPQVGGDALVGQGIADMGAEAMERGLNNAQQQLVSSEAQLADLMGDKTKAAKAWKRLQASPTGGEYLPRAEGFRQQYDESLPNKLEKLVKPLGGSVERGAVRTAPTPSMPDNPEYMRGFNEVLDPTATVEAWIARLSPEMKERIRKEGLPLLTALWAAEQARRGTLGDLARPAEADRER